MATVAASTRVKRYIAEFKQALFAEADLRHRSLFQSSEKGQVVVAVALWTCGERPVEAREFQFTLRRAFCASVKVSRSARYGIGIGEC